MALGRRIFPDNRIGFPLSFIGLYLQAVFPRTPLAMGNHQVSGCDPDPWESHPCLFRRQPRTEVSLCPVSVMASSESDSDFAALVCSLDYLTLAISSLKEEVSWRTCSFGWGSCPDTGNVPDEWVFNCQGSLRSLYASHVVDHGKGKNIRLQEKYFEIFHSDLLSGILGNKKSPDFHIGKSGRL